MDTQKIDALDTQKIDALDTQKIDALDTQKVDLDTQEADALEDTQKIIYDTQRVDFLGDTQKMDTQKVDVLRNTQINTQNMDALGETQKITYDTQQKDYTKKMDSLAETQKVDNEKRGSTQDSVQNTFVHGIDEHGQHTQDETLGGTLADTQKINTQVLPKDFDSFDHTENSRHIMHSHSNGDASDNLNSSDNRAQRSSFHKVGRTFGLSQGVNTQMIVSSTQQNTNLHAESSQSKHSNPSQISEWITQDNDMSYARSNGEQLNHDPQQTEPDQRNRVVDHEQYFGFGYDPTQVIPGGQDLTQDLFQHTQKINDLRVQSHRQVLNTQEVEEYNSANLNTQEEIKTDEEGKLGKLNENHSQPSNSAQSPGLSVPYDDSLFAHTMKRRKLSPQKLTTEIVESSPVVIVSKSDPFARSSPTKEYDHSIRSDVFKIEDPPSSPEKPSDVTLNDILEGIASKEESLSSDIDDIDEEYSDNSIKHAKRKISRYVVDTQSQRSQSPRSEMTVADEEREGEYCSPKDINALMELAGSNERNSEKTNRTGSNEFKNGYKDNEYSAHVSQNRRLHTPKELTEKEQNISNSQVSKEVTNDRKSSNGWAQNTSQTGSQQGSQLTEEKLDILTEADIIHPESVWATYNLNIYTGRIVEHGADVLTVEFTEGVSSIRNGDIFLLDIRIGDIIRIRNQRAKFMVTALQRSEDLHLKCVRGYDLVVVKRKNSKKSKEMTIDLGDCFMEYSDWALHQQRFGLFVDGADLHKQSDLKGKPYESFLQSTRALSMPASPLKVKLRLNTTSKLLVEYKEGISLSESSSERVFKNMLFCLTSVEGTRKEEITDLIKKHGGLLVDTGIDELFTYTKTETGLSLKCNIVGYTFGALISNGHCRSAKYLQTLALGWPILADTFIDECVRKPTRVSSWPAYLLPAGQSREIGTVKSIDVFKFRMNYALELPLSQQLHNNSDILAGVNVVVLVSKQSSTSVTATCKFIFHCFGAKSLAYAYKPSEAAALVKEISGCGEQIMVFDDAEELKKTRNTSLFVSVINWEWVVQCVIGGCKWDAPEVGIECDSK